MTHPVASVDVTLTSRSFKTGSFTFSFLFVLFDDFFSDSLVFLFAFCFCGSSAAFLAGLTSVTGACCCSLVGASFLAPIALVVDDTETEFVPFAAAAFVEVATLRFEPAELANFPLLCDLRVSFDVLSG